MEGLTVAKSMLSAYLHPSRTDDVRQGVLQLLNSLLLRYNEEFDGVVLAYLDIKICNWTAKILSGISPYLSLKLKATLLLFSPKPGMLLEGKVNKVEKDYIGVIVLGIFNAAIAFEDIREEFCYQDNVDGIPMWGSTSSDHVITLGSTIKFAVKSVQEESFLDISGSLKPPNTGCVNWVLSPLEKNSDYLEVERKIHKKERKRERRRENIDADVNDGGRVSKEFPADHLEVERKSHKKERKRERRKENIDADVNDIGRISKEFSADHSHEREHKQKSKVKRSYTDAEVKDGGKVIEVFPANYINEREEKYKSKRKRNDTDSGVKDGCTVGKEFPADNFHETKYKSTNQKEKELMQRKICNFHFLNVCQESPNVFPDQRDFLTKII